MLITGLDSQGHQKQIQWFIEAKSNSGPEIPAAPAVILTTQLLSQDNLIAGAQPCIGLITLPDYLNALSAYPITTHIFNTKKM